MILQYPWTIAISPYYITYLYDLLWGFLNWRYPIAGWPPYMFQNSVKCKKVVNAWL